MQISTYFQSTKCYPFHRDMFISCTAIEILSFRIKNVFILWLWFSTFCSCIRN
uniref:Uncharacterized protein n=1 Tax=Anguilla anguilla TaxID=7936 RepID=A0A0E9XR02_ANGAN